MQDARSPGIQTTPPYDQSWITLSTTGDVVQLRAISLQQHRVLSMLQQAMARDVFLGTLSGCDLDQYRALHDSPSQKHPQALGMLFVYA